MVMEKSQDVPLFGDPSRRPAQGQSVPGARASVPGAADDVSRPAQAGESSGLPLSWDELKKIRDTEAAADAQQVTQTRRGSYVRAKLHLEATSAKNLAVIVASVGVGLSYLGGNIHGPLATELFAVVWSVYLGARAYVDSTGEGTTAKALTLSGTTPPSSSEQRS